MNHYIAVTIAVFTDLREMRHHLIATELPFSNHRVSGVTQRTTAPSTSKLPIKECPSKIASTIQGLEVRRVTLACLLDGATVVSSF